MKGKQRVLHVYSGNMWGGVERVLLNLLTTQSISRFHHGIALFYDGLLAERLRGSGQSPQILGAPRFSRPLTLLKPIFNLTSAMNQYDTCIFHDVWSYSIGALSLSSTPRGLWLHNPLGSYILDRVPRLRQPAAVAACSAYVGRSVASVLPTASPHVLTPPLELPSPPTSDDRHALRRRLGLDDDRLAILFAGRFSAYKGQRWLIEGLAAAGKDINASVFIAGEPFTSDERTYRDELQALAQERGVGDAVVFLGLVNDMNSLYGAMDGYAQPCTSPEPFGLSYVEALARGLPVLGASDGGAQEILAPLLGSAAYSWSQKPSATEVSRWMAGLRTSTVAEEARQSGPKRSKELCDPSAAWARIDTFIECAMHQ